MGYQIAIDGPAGAGKSTIAKKVAAKLGYIYVDTGAMYRTMGLYFKKKGIDYNNEEAVSKACNEPEIGFKYSSDNMHVLLNGEDVTGEIRTQEIGQIASVVSTYGAVRKRLVELQREIGEKEDVVMDGRDIASNVLKNAQCKIYLTASARVRATRRMLELEAKNESCNLEEIEAEIIERDERDKNRDINPLVQVPEATLVDSSDMTIDEVVDTIINLVKKQ